MTARSRPGLDTVSPAKRRVLEAFYAGNLPAGQLCAALGRADEEQIDAPPAMPVRGQSFTTALSPGFYGAC